MSRLRHPWLGRHRPRRSWPERRSSPAVEELAGEPAASRGPGSDVGRGPEGEDGGVLMVAAFVGVDDGTLHYHADIMPREVTGAPPVSRHHVNLVTERNLAENRDDHPLEYLDTTEGVERLAEELSGTTELAVDTEGASFHRFVDRVYLLQLSTRDVSAIVDPLPIGTPEGLGALVESERVEKIFHDADYDLRLLRQDYGWQIRNVFDTRVAAQLIGLKAFGLAALLERYFGVKLDKQYQRADWSQRPLTQGMLDYAAQDTRWLPGLRDRLRDELDSRGRLHWAAEEFRRLETVHWEAEEPGSAFLRLKGARDLNRRELAVLRELVSWRDSVAAELDRATFRVMSNDTLLAIAHQQPDNRDALAAVKGMPRGILEHRGSELLARVTRGLAVPESELPRFPRSRRWERDPDLDERVSRLKTIRDRVAAQLELDPGVLCSRDRLETIARSQPQSLAELAETPGMRGWQVEVLGDEMLRALRGGSAVASPDATGGERSPATDGSASTGAAGAARTSTSTNAEPTAEESPYREG